MTTLREAAQQALEILERLHGGCTDSDDGTVEAITIWVPEIIDALRAALAEPVQAKPWVGLTEDERTDICDGYGANIHWRAFRAIEAKLQEKNT